jgi:hypothetical protein
LVGFDGQGCMPTIQTTTPLEVFGGVKLEISTLREVRYEERNKYIYIRR